MRPLIIFGLTDVAEMAHFYFTNHTEYAVAAFTVDAPYVGTGRFCGLPVVPFEELTRSHPPATHSLFVAVGFKKLNELRKDRYAAGKQLGYELASYVSPKATVLNEGRIGDNCFVLEDNTIQPFAAIGCGVTLWSGNHIGHHSTIGDFCFVTSHVVVAGRVSIGPGCFLGINSTIRDHVTVGENSVIGAGALVLADVAPGGVYLGAATERSAVPSRRLRMS